MSTDSELVTQPTAGVGASLTAIPTVVRGDGTVEDHTNDPKPVTIELKEEPAILKFLKDLQASPEKYPNDVVFDHLFSATKEHAVACFNAQLPEMAQLQYNCMAMGMNVIQRALLQRHGIPLPEQRPQQQAQKPLVTLG
jgi:hypothetical protein